MGRVIDQFHTVFFNRIRSKPAAQNTLKAPLSQAGLGQKQTLAMQKETRRAILWLTRTAKRFLQRSTFHSALAKNLSFR